MANALPKDTSHFKLLVSDFDGTLVGPVRKVSPKIKDAIKTWEESGRYFVIATGRQYLMIKHDISPMRLKSPIIVRGGSEIVDPKTEKVIYSEYIESTAVKKFVSVVTKAGYDAIIEKDDFLFTDIPYGVDYPFLKKVPLASFSGSAPKINVRVGNHNPEEMVKFMKKEVEPQFPTIHITKSYSPLGKSWDITSQRATKHLAILELIKILNISRKDTVGVGDGYNDFPLLEATGFKVAMGNANEELKAIADFIAPPQSEDGVAYLIDKLMGS